MSNRLSAKEKFEKYIIRGPYCWSWMMGTHRGYGQITFGGKTRKLHRVSWELHHGPIPEGLCVCHKCDNRICSNPDHLFLGTYKDNVDDSIAKGRHSHGSKHGHSTLKTQDICAIFKLRRVKNMPRDEVAKRFNIHRCHINKLLKGRAWIHLYDRLNEMFPKRQSA